MVFPSRACSQLLIVSHLGTERMQGISSPWASGGIGTSALSSRAARLSSFLRVNRAMRVSWKQERLRFVLWCRLSLPGWDRGVTEAFGRVGVFSQFEVIQS